MMREPNGTTEICRAKAGQGKEVSLEDEHPCTVSQESWQEETARFGGQLTQYPGYEVMFLNQETNRLAGARASGIHIASISGGVPSHYMADLLIKEYGRDAVLLWFADTNFEDDDAYRFLHDCMRRWGGRLYWYKDGRNPYEVAAQRKLIPNNLNTPCSYELKVKPFRQFIQAMDQIPVVYIGLEIHEKKRLCTVPESYAKAIPQARVVFPLNCPEIAALDLHVIIREEWGIETPRLYHQGYAHDNCGGRCCRQGMGEWIRTAVYYPERFAQMACWEQMQRNQGGARSNRTICAVQRNGKKEPITLYQVLETRQHLFTK